MSARSYASFLGVAKIRARLQKITEGLIAVSGVAAVEAAGQVIEGKVRTVATSQLERHRASGDAIGSLDVARAGGLITVTANRYCGMHKWYSFRTGVPPFIVKMATKVLAATLLALIKGTDAASSEAGLLAAEIALPEEAKSARKAVKRHHKRVARLAARDQRRAASKVVNARKKADRKVANTAAAKERRESRAYDRRVKAREAREG